MPQINLLPFVIDLGYQPETVAQHVEHRENPAASRRDAIGFSIGFPDIFQARPFSGFGRSIPTFQLPLQRAVSRARFPQLFSSDDVQPASPLFRPQTGSPDTSSYPGQLANC
jgi:hypothetical protein